MMVDKGVPVVDRSKDAKGQHIREGEKERYKQQTGERFTI